MASSKYIGKNDFNILWGSLKDAGYDDAAAAGLLSNAWYESGATAANWNNGVEAAYAMNDAQLTARVDSGGDTYQDLLDSGKRVYGAIGYSQWASKDALYNYAKSKGTSIGDPLTQAEYFIQQANDYGMSPEKLNGKSPTEVAEIYSMKIEMPGSKEWAKKHAMYADGIYGEISGKTVDWKSEYIPADFSTQTYTMSKGNESPIYNRDGTLRSVKDYGDYTGGSSTSYKKPMTDIMTKGFKFNASSSGSDSLTPTGNNYFQLKQFGTDFID